MSQARQESDDGRFLIMPRTPSHAPCRSRADAIRLDWLETFGARIDLTVGAVTLRTIDGDWAQARTLRQAIDAAMAETQAQDAGAGTGTDCREITASLGGLERPECAIQASLESQTASSRSGFSSSGWRMSVSAYSQPRQ
jgi:hypothetical protein